MKTYTPPASASLFLILFTALCGCLPSSCRRSEPRALTPADSLSRSAAEAAPVDSLRLLWSTEGPENHRLSYPRTVLFSPDRQIIVSDAENDAVFEYDPSGRFVRRLTTKDLDAPYLAGRIGDTLLVFSPAPRRLEYLIGGRTVRQIYLPDLDESPRALSYVGIVGERLFYKRVGPDSDNVIAEISASGDQLRTIVLPGPYWRHAGLLKAWGDSLLSLSGYRPVVDILSGGTLDTLALIGFDSPMLPRSRSFMRGEVREAPLLTTSAAPAGDYLFVLNLRSGWIQIDVFNRLGHIEHRLVESGATYRSEFYPQDLDVQARPDGSYELAVVISKPRPVLALYEWDLGTRSTPPEGRAVVGASEMPAAGGG